MEINFTHVFFLTRKGILKTIMRSFILLFCGVAFGFSPKFGFSQNAKIVIKSDVTLSVDHVFELIQNQTDYNFIYGEDLFKNAPEVKLKKGIITASKLLELSLASGNFVYEFTSDKTIILSRKAETSSLEATQTVQSKISGTVKDSNGNPLPGATVLEKGTNNAVAADLLGNFALTVKDSNTTLIFSFIGFYTTEIVIGNQTEINVVLKESAFELEAVNVISTGYQKITKEKITGAAANIDNQYFENSNKISLQESLQGSVAGLQIFSNTTHPQATPQVIIRGVGSAFQEGVNVAGLGAPAVVLGNPAILTPGSPLYVIDGVPTFDGKDLSSINSNDIKSITVLKDGAATSIYGARAANGVIVVETKSGRKGGARITYSSQFGVSEFTDLNERLNSSQLQELYIEGLINNATNGITTEAAALSFLATPGGTIIPFNVNQDTNWEKELTRQSNIIQHNLSVSGGNEANQYYFSLGYLKNETGIKEVDFQRVSLRLKYDTQVSDKFKISTNIGFGNTDSDNYETGSSFYSPFRNIYRLRPDFKVYNDDGTYDLSYNSKVNPLGILTDEIRTIKTNDFRGAIDLNYEIISNLTFETTFSGNYGLTENYNNFPGELGKGFNNGSSFAIQQNVNAFNWNARSLLRYNLKLGESHNITTFAGIENNAMDTKITNVSVNKMRDGAETLDNGTTVNTYTKRSESAISSLFLNVDYAYQNKYLANASFRRDGSSRFGASKRYGNFYALGLGWNIHKEDFMANQTAFNLLKLRTSYGVNGNDQIGSFNYVWTFSGTGFYNDQNAITFASAGNASLSWEENATFDVGVDFAIFNNRLSGFVDYYSRDTDKLLYNLPTSALNGDNFIFQNFGGMKNSGIEVSLNTKNIISDTNGFTWDTGITFTTNKNEITDLKIDDGVSGNYLRKVGEDFNTLNLYGYAGVDPETGVELFYTDETETATTGVLTEAVKYNHGKTTPDFYGSFTNIFSYKNFSLLTQFYTSWGGQIFETTGNLQNDNGNNGLRDFSNTSKYVYDNRWQNPGDVTDVPKYVYLNAASSAATSRWLHDASYVRLKKVEISYDFSNKVLEKTFIDNLRLYVSADNLWTYTKDDTLQNDPEIGGITGSASFDTPMAKTVYFGLNVSF